MSTSREIKFRAMADDLTKWLYGNLTTVNKVYCRIDDELAAVRTLGQYTGLKDKGGKEIYEGDLLKLYAGNEQNKSKIWEVIFYEGAFCLKRTDWEHKPTAFITYSDQCFNNGIDMDCTSQIEVIGNKFENSTILSNAN